MRLKWYDVLLKYAYPGYALLQSCVVRLWLFVYRQHSSQIITRALFFMHEPYLLGQKTQMLWDGTDHWASAISIFWKSMVHLIPYGISNCVWTSHSLPWPAYLRTTRSADLIQSVWLARWFENKMLHKDNIGCIAILLCPLTGDIVFPVCLKW